MKTFKLLAAASFQVNTRRIYINLRSEFPFPEKKRSNCFVEERDYVRALRLHI